MKRIVLLVVAGLLLLVGVMSAGAQDDAPICDAAAAADVLAGLVEALRTTDSPIDALGAIALAAGSAASDCAGLTFSSETITAKEVVGPVTIPAGIYIVSLTAEEEDRISLEVTELEGDCNVFGSYIFTVAMNGDQKVLEVEEGCKALLSFTPTTFDFEKDGPVWTLTFEKVQ